jgi:uncharacterized membrane-anchored protein
MNKKAWCLGLLALLTWVSAALADVQPPSPEELQKLIKGLKPQHGIVNLPGGLAKLNLPTNIVYLDPNDADTVLVKIWLNPPGEKTLGMLIPADRTPGDPDCWGVTITSTEEGYVKDDDAGKINYDDLLKQMQAATLAENKERTASGYPPIELVGWAEPPHYETNSHKLYWAKEYKVGNSGENSLNYDIRILGRRGFLVLSAIAGMDQLPEIKREAPQILGLVEFNDGSRYTDFDPKVDKVATYGLAALVAGGIAAKLGFFKLLWVGLIAAKKFIIIGVVAVSAWVRKFFKKRSDPAA